MIKNYCTKLKKLLKQKRNITYKEYFLAESNDWLVFMPA